MLSDLWRALVIVPWFQNMAQTLSKAVGQVDPSFRVVKISHFNTKYPSYSQSTNSTKQTVYVGCQYSKTKVGNQPVNMHIDQTSGHYWF